ncbi:MAG: ABC transporter substrate-binding protein [Candidatus Cloacimonetes bacterium]|nr:ABC transporter substrate-binding protein [Candidatus Cloacimonadota bacterium]
MKKEPIAIMEFLLLIALLLCLIPTGCKKEAEHKSAHTAQSPENEQSGSYFTIRVSPKWHPQTQFAGMYMAIKKGYYADHKLKVEVLPYTPIEQQLESIRTDKSDVVSMDLLQAIKLYHDHKELVNIGQTAQRNSVFLVGRKSRGIRSLNDFNGKRLGIWRSSSNLITKAYLQDYNIDVELVPIEWSINLFTQNVVDIINVMSYNEYHQILQAGIPEDDLFVISLDLPDYSIPDEGYYVKADFYRQHPKECRDFIKATMDGWTYAFTHPDETLDEIISIMQDAKIKVNRSHQIWMLKEMKKVVLANPALMGKLDVNDFDKANHLLKRTKTIGHDVKYEEFYPSAHK